MAQRTLTRADLCEAVYKETGLPRTESAALVETVLREITDCLERGETVKLSSFGTFVVRKKGQRIGRNPKTGTEVPISPRRVMVFKPSALLKQHIKTGPAGINADVHYAELPQKAPSTDLSRSAQVVKGGRPPSSAMASAGSIGGISL